MLLYQTPRNEQIPDLPRRLMSTILTYTFASRSLGPAAQHPVYVRHRYPESQMAKKHKERKEGHSAGSTRYGRTPSFFGGSVSVQQIAQNVDPILHPRVNTSVHQDQKRNPANPLHP
ncbi:hypothetical protein PC9H_004101 [Pleurotus ostreatus]|uniref:Uncharacterized protein n=1 Tax=Pleurotus ostreatus TaxID=5322 RepID=A0A8H7A2P0_PLEOS|nr:uncharacterized protein PC9H_004101 [Pleurotus ostreatus]KAF7437264.1 hypothetical protein PC9H_004101 [Pleurotus ostreatus]